MNMKTKWRHLKKILFPSLLGAIANRFWYLKKRLKQKFNKSLMSAWNLSKIVCVRNIVHYVLENIYYWE